MTKPSTAIRTDHTIPSGRLSPWARTHNGATTRRGQPIDAGGDLFIGTITNAASGERPTIWSASPGIFASALADYNQTVFDLREQHSPLSPSLMVYSKMRAVEYFTDPNPDEEAALVYVQAQYAAKTRAAGSAEFSGGYRSVCRQAGAVLQYLTALRNGVDIGAPEVSTPIFPPLRLVQ